MAEESTNSVESTEQVEEQAEERHETDWKAEARKWEKRAKGNQSAAEELEKLKAAQMTELEKAQAEAAKAQAEADALKAEKAKADAAIKVGAETGIPTEILMYCSDPESIDAFAKALKGWAEKDAAQIRVGSSTGKSRILHQETGAKVANRDIFASLFNTD